MLDPALDKRGGSPDPSSRYCQGFHELLLHEIDLVDIWQFRNPGTFMFTWQSKTPPIQCRLDFWLISAFLSECVKCDKIRPSIKTDHSLISLQLQGNSYEKRGPGFWKFNTSLLQDQPYVENIKNLIHVCKDKYAGMEDKGLLWDSIKCEIRGSTIKYSKMKRKKEREKETNLKKELNSLSVNTSTLSEAELHRLEEVQSLLVEINDKQTEGVMIRSKARWIELGEKNTKYFCALEKRNYKTKHITKLLKSDGTEVSDPKLILQEEKLFYQKLYTCGEIGRASCRERV